MKKIYSFLFAISISLSFSFAQNAKIQSIFVSNFVKYIEFPESSRTGDFVISVLGSGDVYNEMVTMSKQKKTFGSQPIVIKQINSIGEYTPSQILVVSSAQSSHLSEAVKKTTGQPTILISETANGIVTGAMINFVYKDGRQKFEISRANGAKNKLLLSNYLESLAIK